jgi:hypothetical protein
MKRRSPTQAKRSCFQQLAIQGDTGTHKFVISLKGDLVVKSIPERLYRTRGKYLREHSEVHPKQEGSIGRARTPGAPSVVPFCRLPFQRVPSSLSKAAVVQGARKPDSVGFCGIRPLRTERARTAHPVARGCLWSAKTRPRS